MSPHPSYFAPPGPQDWRGFFVDFTPAASSSRRLPVRPRAFTAGVSITTDYSSVSLCLDLFNCSSHASEG
jgi:hypothetical protein